MTAFVIESEPHFWTHVAEYPTHHLDLPPNTEWNFVESIKYGETLPSSGISSGCSLPKAKQAIQRGFVFSFTEHQIDQFIIQYLHLTSKLFFLFFQLLMTQIFRSQVTGTQYDAFSWLANRSRYAPQCNRPVFFRICRQFSVLRELVTQSDMFILTALRTRQPYGSLESKGKQRNLRRYQYISRCADEPQVLDQIE